MKQFSIMKRFALGMVILLASLNSLSANNIWESDESINHYHSLLQQSNSATITFKNKSDYTMTLKILYKKGGLYSTITLSPHSTRTVYFGSSNSFKLKIKAVHNGSASYHDGGDFSVTCTSMEWTEGEMSFSLSTYGTGLGPSISAKEFESNN